MIITERVDANGNEYDVLSDSGSAYRIRYVGCGDESGDISLWDCDCPSMKFNKTCKHMDEFLRLRANGAL